MTAAAQPLQYPLQVDPEALAAWRAQGLPHAVLDIREPWETDLCAIDGCLKIPMGELADALGALPAEVPIVVVCHHGVRSMNAVAWMRENGFDRAINLRGGIEQWARRVEPGMNRY